jgi:peptide methionine sulfoxide reductase msrA/msrB
MNRNMVKVLVLFSVLPLLLGVEMNSAKQKRQKIPIFNAATDKIEEVERIYKTDAEWRKVLTPEQFRIMRQKGTERAFSVKCPLPPKGGSGIYQCAACGTDLFRYDNKFESGTGWPSFWEPVSDLNIQLRSDNSLGMQRTEVLCARCDAHLGHVFDDGPPPTGKRYCINAVALKLSMPEEEKSHNSLQKATFSAGCFWGVQAAFAEQKGVILTQAGYTGGYFKKPTYEDVCSDKTGHAEAVEIIYDPAEISYEKLLDVFWSIHDPTTPNRQGPDIGSQYRSAIFYHSPEQKEQAERSKENLEKSGKFKRPIVTEIVAAQDFYPAEEYHQQYFKKHGMKPTCHIKE